MRLRGPRIGRGDNTDQLSFRSSSVLTALRAPNVRFPTLRAAHCCCRRCCCCSGACLPALPTALTPPTSSYQIIDAIVIYPPLLLRRISRASHFFNAPGGDRTWTADSKVITLNLYTMETYNICVLSMSTTTADKNCNVVANYPGDIWIHPHARTGTRGAAPRLQPASKKNLFGSAFFFFNAPDGDRTLSLPPESLVLTFTPSRCQFHVCIMIWPIDGP